MGLAADGPPIVPLESPTSLIPPWFAFSIGTKLHDLFEFLAFVTQPADAYIIGLATSHWNSEVAYTLTKNKILDCVQDETASSDSTITCESVAEKLDLEIPLWPDGTWKPEDTCICWPRTLPRTDILSPLMERF